LPKVLEAYTSEGFADRSDLRQNGMASMGCWTVGANLSSMFQVVVGVAPITHASK